VQAGYIQNKYISMPDNSSASVDNAYTDISFFSLSGNVVSKIRVNNNTDTNIKTDSER